MTKQTPHVPGLSKHSFARRFVPLFVLFQTGTFNDNALKNGLIALITFGGVVFLSDLPPAIRVPIVALIFTAPFLILCAIAGQIADKVDRGLIFRWVKRAEVLIMLIAGLGFLLSSVHILAVALGLMGAQSAFFSPTKNAVLPQWLSDEELIRGNALLSGFQFTLLLIGQIVGTALVMAPDGPLMLAGLLFALALLGWFAAEKCLPAPPPLPNLKINWEPITAMIGVMAQAIREPDVLRPLLGIAWFYGLSTIFITTFPNYVGDVMGYDFTVLIALFICSTFAILIGAIIVMVVGNMKVWGPEAVRLSTLGIVGVTFFGLLIYLAPTPVYGGAENFGPFSDFIEQPEAIWFLATVVGASISNGIFVVPLQAMAQRRANPDIRARLMSAGSVLLNLSVNVVTFGLIGLAALRMPPKMAFLMIVIGSAAVAVYAIWRSLHPVNRVPAKLDPNTPSKSG